MSPSDEHVDISFEVTRYGSGDRIKVLVKRVAKLP